MRRVAREGRLRRSSYDRRAMGCMHASAACAGYIPASCGIPPRRVVWSPRRQPVTNRTRESSRAAGGVGLPGAVGLVPERSKPSPTLPALVHRARRVERGHHRRLVAASLGVASQGLRTHPRVCRDRPRACVIYIIGLRTVLRDQRRSTLRSRWPSFWRSVRPILLGTSSPQPPRAPIGSGCPASSGVSSASSFAAGWGSASSSLARLSHRRRRPLGAA